MDIPLEYRLAVERRTGTLPLEQGLKCARRTLSEFFADEGGAALIEYGLVAALIAFAIFSILISMRDSVNIAYTGVNSDLESAIVDMQPPGG